MTGSHSHSESASAPHTVVAALALAIGLFCVSLPKELGQCCRFS